MTALRQHGSGPTGRERLTRVVATALVAYVFYLALGDPTDSFDLATGAVSAVVVVLFVNLADGETGGGRA